MGKNAIKTLLYVSWVGRWAGARGIAAGWEEAGQAQKLGAEKVAGSQGPNYRGRVGRREGGHLAKARWGCPAEAGYRY